MGFKEAAAKAAPVLLEPIMAVEVVTPEEYMVDVIGDSTAAVAGSRAWKPRHLCSRSGPSAAVGDVRLRHRPALTTQGRATYTMQFAQYHEVPATISAEIVKRVRGE
jgi:elongation factor G